MRIVTILLLCAVQFVACNPYIDEVDVQQKSQTEEANVVAFWNLFPDPLNLDKTVGLLQKRMNHQLDYVTAKGNLSDRYYLQVANSFPRTVGRSVHGPYIDLISYTIDLRLHEHSNFILMSPPKDKLSIDENDVRYPSFAYFSSIKDKIDDHNISCRRLGDVDGLYVQEDDKDMFVNCIIAIKIDRSELYINAYIHNEYISSTDVDKLLIQMVDRLQHGT